MIIDNYFTIIRGKAARIFYDALRMKIGAEDMSSITFDIDIFPQFANIMIDLKDLVHDQLVIED